MKKLVGCCVCFCMMFVGLSVAMAGNCRTDGVAKRWVEERNRAEVLVLQAWARGETADRYADQVALILSDELYLCSACRDDRVFLEENLHVLSKGAEPTVETIPGIILERFLGKDFLSPRRQYGTKAQIGRIER